MMENAYLNPVRRIIADVDELWLSSCLQERRNADPHLERSDACDPHHLHLVSSPQSVVMSCDACSLRLASSPDSATTCEPHNPHPTSPATIVHDNVCSMWDRGSPQFATQKKIPMNALVGNHLMQSFKCTSDRVNSACDTTDAIGPPYLKSKNMLDWSLSPASKHAPVDITRAASEFSYKDHDDDGLGTYCEQNSRLLTEVLASQCSFLKAQNDLGLPSLNADLASLDKEAYTRQASHSNSVDRDDEREFYSSSSSLHHGIYKGKAHVAPQCLNRKTKDMMCSENSFRHKHFEGLCDIPDKRTTSRSEEDPIFALQGRLQDLLLVARVSDFVQEQGKDERPSSRLESTNVKDHSDRYEDGIMGMLGRDVTKSLSVDKSSEAAAVKKELSLISADLAEVKKMLASQKIETPFCLRRQTQQTVAEEMYCKETIQRLVQETQAEIEQWGHMQGILHKLQEEFDGLREAQRFWEERAHRAEALLSSIQEELHDWRCQARSTQEELVMMRCERQILKNRIEMMEDAQLCMPGVIERREEQNCVGVGTRREEFGASESFVHSRNESGRSSVDLGTSSQRSFRKSIKKSLSFANNKENISTNTFQFGNLEEPTRPEYSGFWPSSRKAAVGSKAKVKNPQPFAHFLNVDFVKLDSSELLNEQERKKARLFAFKDKLTSASNVSKISLNSENFQGCMLVGNANCARQDGIDTLWTLNPKASLPCAPTSTPLPSVPNSTPSRVVFGNIVNISKQ